MTGHVVMPSCFSVERLARCVLVALLTVAWLWSAPAQAADGVNHAGLIVRHGDGRLTYAYIAFDEETINGIELLRRSAIPLVTVGFGGLGEGVCSLDGEGCPASDCRKRVCQGFGEDAPFWQYFRLTEPDVWKALTLGASATKVRDGEVYGWSWTGDEPGLPAATLADVARLAGVAEPAAVSSIGAVPTAAVRDVYPAGVSPRRESDGQSLTTYLAAAVVLILIGGGALYVGRLRRGANEAQT